MDKIIYLVIIVLVIIVYLIISRICEAIENIKFYETQKPSTISFKNKQEFNKFVEEINKIQNAADNIEEEEK